MPYLFLNIKVLFSISWPWTAFRLLGWRSVPLPQPKRSTLSPISSQKQVQSSRKFLNKRELQSINHQMLQKKLFRSPNQKRRKKLSKRRNNKSRYLYNPLNYHKKIQPKYKRSPIFNKNLNQKCTKLWSNITITRKNFLLWMMSYNSSQSTNNIALHWCSRGITNLCWEDFHQDKK